MSVAAARADSEARRAPLWLAVVGKGGSGKSVIAGTLARVLARRGRRVLALDSDPMPGLALSLGAEEPAEPPLNDAIERDEDGPWRLKHGIGPVRAIQRFSTDAPDDVRLLQLGKTKEGGQLHVGAATAYWKVANGLEGTETFRDWIVIADVPAGPRQVGARFAAFARIFVVVVEPGWASALAGRRVARIARMHPGAEVLFVASKVRGTADRRHVEKLVGEPVFASVPLDDAVRSAERAGAAVLDAAPGCPAVRAVEALAAELEARTLQGP